MVSPTVNKLNTEFWHGEGHLSTNTTPGREAERNSIQRLQSTEGQVRLDDLSKNLSHDRKLGLEVDLFTSRVLTQLPTFVSWRPDPEAMATDAFTLDWANLSQPSLECCGQHSGPTSATESRSGLHGTSLLITNLVPSTTGDVQGLSMDQRWESPS